MAYSGYLVKVGSYNIPLKYIQANSYNVTYNTIDIDSYRDANGELHRSALQHKVGKIDFNTVPMLTETEMLELIGNISSNYSNATEKKALVTYYNPESGTYITQSMYVPDISFSMYGVFDGVIRYNATRLAFIGY